MRAKRVAINGDGNEIIRVGEIHTRKRRTRPDEKILSPAWSSEHDNVQIVLHDLAR